MSVRLIVAGLVAAATVAGCAAVGKNDADGHSSAPVASTDTVTRIALPSTAGRPAADGPGSTPAGTHPAGQVPAMPLRLPACRLDDLPASHAGYDEWSRTIVDTIWALPATYVPPDLVPIGRAGIQGPGKVRSLVIDDLRAMAEAADHAGVPLAVQSAYRSHNRQARVFAEWVAASGEAEALRFSARPGHSEHQLGTTLDLREANGPAPWQVDFGSRKLGRWLVDHATEFGFVVSYPVERGASDLLRRRGLARPLRRPRHGSPRRHVRTDAPRVALAERRDVTPAA